MAKQWKSKESNGNKDIEIKIKDKVSRGEQTQSDSEQPTQSRDPQSETVEIETTDGRIVTITIAERSGV